jgi:hypothetical protein
MKKFSEFSKKPVRRIYEQEEETQTGFSAAQMVTQPVKVQTNSVSVDQINQQVTEQQPTQEVENQEENQEQPKLEPSNEGVDVSKFFSKIFESKEMAHIYHLQVRGDEGSYAKHQALGDYYEEILELLDDTIEIYQGQYGLIEGYETIDTSSTKSKDSLAYFEELATWIKHARKCISEEDTHLHSMIDDIVCLIYKTIYKLRFMK